MGIILDCLETVVKGTKVYQGLVREMILSAIWLLQCALSVSMDSWMSLNKNLDSLRSDERAFACIRKWERNSTIPNILYFSLLLNARKLISQISKNTDEYHKIVRMQTELKLIVQTELPLKMMKREVRRDNVVGGSLILHDNLKKELCSVHELQLLAIKTRDDIGTVFYIYLEHCTLYISVDEFCSEKDPETMYRIYHKIKQEIYNGSLVMYENPMIYVYE